MSRYISSSVEDNNHAIFCIVLTRRILKWLLPLKPKPEVDFRLYAWPPSWKVDLTSYLRRGGWIWRNLAGQCTMTCTWMYIGQTESGILIWCNKTGSSYVHQPWIQKFGLHRVPSSYLNQVTPSLLVWSSIIDMRTSRCVWVKSGMPT